MHNIIEVLIVLIVMDIVQVMVMLCLGMNMKVFYYF